MRHFGDKQTQQMLLEDVIAPKLLGFDVGVAGGDYTVEMEVRVDAKGVIRVVSIRARSGAPRPDPGTDKADNGLQGT